VKLYVAAAVEALRKKERQDQNWWKKLVGWGPSYFVL
jgi:hypothetical protein